MKSKLRRQRLKLLEKRFSRNSKRKKNKEEVKRNTQRTLGTSYTYRSLKNKLGKEKELSLKRGIE